MLHYVYYPFPEGSATGANGATLSRYTKKYSNPANNAHDETDTDRRILIYKPPVDPQKREEGPLHPIRDDDMLLIAGHGGDTDPTYIQNDQRQQLTHDNLARQLWNMGLPETHVLIKMLSCFAAGTLKEIDKQVTRLPINGTCFVQNLARSLDGLGYHKVIVGGYAGDVNTGGAASRRSEARTKAGQNIMVSVDYAGGRTGREDAHLHIVWVDAKGSIVSRDYISKIKRESDLKDGKFEKHWRWGEVLKRTRPAATAQ